MCVYWSLARSGPRKKLPALRMPRLFMLCYYYYYVSGDLCTEQFLFRLGYENLHTSKHYDASLIELILF